VGVGGWVGVCVGGWVGVGVGRRGEGGSGVECELGVGCVMCGTGR
jgi:hypothetical protein